MLAHDDLQAIKEIVGESTKTIETSLRKEIQDVQTSLHGEMQSLEAMIQKELKPMKKDMKYIKKTLDVAIEHFDRTDVSFEKRLVKIENKLSMSHQVA
jgi:hypothetical protein